MRVLLLLLVFIATPSVWAEDMEDNLTWVVYCEGDIQKAKIVDFLEAQSATAPFCVKLDESQFTPLLPPSGTPSYAWEKSKKIWLLVDSSSNPSPTDIWNVSVRIERELPQCTRCEQDCMRLKSKQSSEVKADLKFPKKGSTRSLVDVTRDVKDWRFLSLSMKARVEGPLSTFNSSKDVRGWKWCRADAE